MKQSIALIGPGRVGCAVGKRLHLAGYPLTAIISRSRERAEEACSYIGCEQASASAQLTAASDAQIILLAVPDDHIQNTASKFLRLCQHPEQTTLIHFSGLHCAEIMRQKTSSAMLLSLHPLLPFADRQKAFKTLHLCPCAIESNSSQALTLGHELVSAMGGQPFILDARTKPLYHTAASMASNYLVTLLAVARDLLVKCGISSDKALPMLLPLVQTSLDNVKDLGPEQGLSGPLVRGDIGTVAAHIKALKDEAPDLLPLYLQLGKLTVDISLESGRLEQRKATAIKKLIAFNGENPSRETNN
ncbi:Predicted oxidoreductase, contains short-chain dehydrogenase (SDR) and DUF2520 domains [Desulfuromusa kysingii]|uniref:Predicted oxidoreductase, contains short-chain dehydrogenase (SDR) and DUF2520 domains n=1 Tax=Desulfuromusa kysingii TaxID=37625 RepID=A0A1H3WD09_9BACT|nr:Rossmann-like and DUF2520 domain-containing protein [Desulfuromusa kysingii]SDZ85027.1 Predicted oxidoreductase, contains short-chain dehydrogenase (SDR) and DUF2520 domains [Desulfuromusa kysingii]